MNHLKKEYNIIFTLKEFAEVIKLFEVEISSEYKIIGKHKGGSKLLKIWGVFERTVQLLHQIEKFDVKISVGGDSSNLCAKIKQKKSITFDDNETAPNWRYSPFTDLAFWPSVIPQEIITKQGFRKDKDDIYIADYTPDPTFLSNLPFDNYVVVRPENILANYVDSRKTIVPDLVEKLVDNGYNILYLPRYKNDYNLITKSTKIFIADNPLRGLDICYYSNAVLTGAGTFAREAVCLGVPAVSFFAGSRLLLVDQAIIKNKSMIHSRDSQTILKYLSSCSRKNPDFKRSKKVQKEVFEKIDSKLNEWLL